MYKTNTIAHRHEQRYIKKWGLLTLLHNLQKAIEVSSAPNKVQVVGRQTTSKYKGNIENIMAQIQSLILRTSSPVTWNIIDLPLL